jgi:hypothetical protein
VVNFPDAGGEPAVLTEELRQRDDIRQSLAKMAVEVIDLRRIRPRPVSTEARLGLQSGI